MDVYKRVGRRLLNVEAPVCINRCRDVAGAQPARDTGHEKPANATINRLTVPRDSCVSFMQRQPDDGRCRLNDNLQINSAVIKRSAGETRFVNRERRPSISALHARCARNNDNSLTEKTVYRDCHLGKGRTLFFKGHDVLRGVCTRSAFPG
jgi:hypothetical protein